jgi:hypothetical protein
LPFNNLIEDLTQSSLFRLLKVKIETGGKLDEGEYEFEVE